MSRITPFSGGEVFGVFRNHLEGVLREIDGLDNDYVLKSSPAELEEFFIGKASINALRPGDHCIENQRGIQVDVSRAHSRFIRPGSQSHVTGTQIDIAMPYDGDSVLWQVRPSTYAISGYPDIMVHPDKIVFSLSFPDDAVGSMDLKGEVERNIRSLINAVANQQKDVDRYNADVPRAIKEKLAAKRQKALAATSAVAALGIPMKRRDQPASYAVPAKRRATPVRPPVATGQYAPEWHLDEKEYQHIMSVLRSMGLVIERNPDSFKSLDEEAIRDHFLLQLNGHYEGGATGETFNSAGKTDILIRAGDRNAFIAECKFWGGPKRFSEAIDQLLGYLTWRDCKCALLIFNRNRDAAGVAQKMREVMRERPEYRNTVEENADGGSRYILVKESDPGREVVISTLLFDIPSD
jgi:hypothetical protein